MVKTASDRRDLIVHNRYGGKNGQEDFNVGMCVLILFAAILFLFYVGILVFFVARFRRLQSWAKVMGIMGMLPLPIPFGPLVTLLVTIFGVQKASN